MDKSINVHRVAGLFLDTDERIYGIFHI
jgi:hypothetical protein